MEKKASRGLLTHTSYLSACPFLFSLLFFSSVFFFLFRLFFNVTLLDIYSSQRDETMEMNFLILLEIQRTVLIYRWV